MGIILLVKENVEKLMTLNLHLHNLPPFHEVAEQDGQGHNGHAGKDSATNDLKKIVIMKIITTLKIRQA